MDTFNRILPLPWRLAIGMAFFAVLALRDVVRNGKSGKRWREYLFLIMCVALAMAYGVLNDQITSRISWEFFYYGKELWPILGPQTPPDPAALSWQAVRIGLEATWWPGLVIGAAMLLANNPSPHFHQLSYRRLIRYWLMILLIVIASALVLGLAGENFLLNWAGSDFQELTADNLMRPHRFMMAWGIHLGGYIGCVLGLIWAVFSIRRERKRLAVLGA